MIKYWYRYPFLITLSIILFCNINCKELPEHNKQFYVELFGNGGIISADLEWEFQNSHYLTVGLGKVFPLNPNPNIILKYSTGLGVDPGKIELGIGLTVIHTRQRETEKIRSTDDFIDLLVYSFYSGNGLGTLFPMVGTLGYRQKYKPMLLRIGLSPVYVRIKKEDKFGCSAYISLGVNF